MSEHLQHLRSRSMLPSCARRCLGCSSLPCARNRGVASCTTTRYLRSASARSSNTRPCTRHTPPSNRAFPKFATTVRWLVITQKECEAEDAKGGGGERLLAEKVTKWGGGRVTGSKGWRWHDREAGEDGHSWPTHGPRCSRSENAGAERDTACRWLLLLLFRTF